MSAQKISLLTLSVLAAAAITKARFVTQGGVAATAAGTAVGVSVTAAATGELFPVDVLGTSIVEASAAITKGAYVQVATGGKAVTQTTGIAVGQALQAAGADGDLIEVLLIPNAPAPS